MNATSQISRHGVQVRSTEYSYRAVLVASPVLYPVRSVREASLASRALVLSIENSTSPPKPHQPFPSLPTSNMHPHPHPQLHLHAVELHITQ